MSILQDVVVTRSAGREVTLDSLPSSLASGVGGEGTAVEGSREGHIDTFVEVFFVSGR